MKAPPADFHQPCDAPLAAAVMVPGWYQPDGAPHRGAGGSNPLACSDSAMRGRTNAAQDAAKVGTLLRRLAGNTIDFFVQVLGLTFHNAMREITAAESARRENTMTAADVAAGRHQPGRNVPAA
jgi:hypothetical protein